MSREDVLVTVEWAEKNLGTDGIAITEKVTVLPSVLDAPSIRALQPTGSTDSFGPRERVRSSACRSVESRRPSHRYSTTVSRAE